MQFFKTFVSTLFVATAIAMPAPDADVDDLEIRAPEFENLDPAVAELLTLAVEAGDGLEARTLEARGWLCNAACKVSVRPSSDIPFEVSI